MLLNECLDPLGATQSVIAIKENDYFQAARAVGSPAARILWRHVLPNVMPPIIIIFSITTNRSTAYIICKRPGNRGNVAGGVASVWLRGWRGGCARLRPVVC